MIGASAILSVVDEVNALTDPPGSIEMFLRSHGINPEEAAGVAVAIAGDQPATVAWLLGFVVGLHLNRPR